MKLVNKIIIATGTLFGLIASLSLLQRKTILLTGSIEFYKNTKIEDFKKVVLKKEHTIRKITGNNEGFTIFKDENVFLEAKERNSISALGKKMSIGNYKVIPITKSIKLDANIIIELTE